MQAFFIDEFPSPVLNLYFIELVNPTNFFEQLSNSAVNEKWNYIKFNICSTLVTLLFALRFNAEYDITIQYRVNRHFWKGSYFFKYENGYIEPFSSCPGFIYFIAWLLFSSQQFASSNLKREILLCKLSLSSTYQGSEWNSYNQIAIFINKWNTTVSVFWQLVLLDIKICGYNFKEIRKVIVQVD